MIFLTVGSHEPFDRLVQAVDEWCGQSGRSEVFAQITAYGDYQPNNFPFVPVMDAAAYRKKCQAADVLVSHAGMGSIITALNIGTPIVIMPRRGDLRETRNDHQLSTVQHFQDKSGIHIAKDETDIAEALEKALLEATQSAHALISPFAQDRLISFLSAAFKS